MKQYNEQKILAAVLCGALTLSGAEYVAAAENAAEDLAVEEFSLDDYVVTANRMKVRSQDVAAAVTVVNAEDLAKGNYTTVTDALRDKGINVKTNTTGSFVELNGDNRVLLMVNGRRTNWNHGPLISGVGTGLMDLDTFQVENIERIEVVRGPNSSLYGNAAVGGVVNIITKRPQPGMHVKVRGEIGTQSQRRGALRVEGGDDSITYALSVSREMRGNIEYSSPSKGNLTIPDTGMNRTSEALTLDKKFTNGDLLSFEFTNTEANKSKALGGVDADTAQPKYTNSREDETVRSLALTYTWAPVGENGPQDFVRIYHTQEQQDGGFYPATLTNELTAMGAEYQKNWLLNDKNTLISGVSFHHEKIKEENDGSLDRSANTTALYLEDNWRMGQGWSMNLGTRWEDHSDFGADVTSHIGVNKELSAATNAFLSWGQAISNPTLKMRYANTRYWIGNENLQQEKSQTITVGFKSQLSAGTNLDASFYYSKVKDALEWVTNIKGYQNVERETRRGLDFNLRHKFSPQWSARLGYSYAQVEESGASGYQQLYRSNNQPNRYLLGVSYKQDKWDADLTLQHIAGRVLGTDAFLKSKYTTLDAVVNYHCTDKTKLYLKGYNLTNTSYESIAHGVDSYYMAPSRSVVFGIQHEF